MERLLRRFTPRNDRYMKGKIASSLRSSQWL